jgi:hypothetical protein
MLELVERVGRRPAYPTSCCKRWHFAGAYRQRRSLPGEWLAGSMPQRRARRLTLEDDRFLVHGVLSLKGQ